MQRLSSIARPDWRARCEAVGFDYHTIDGTYWDESACYRFNSAQIDQLEAAANQLHAMVREVVARVIKQGDYQGWGLSELAIRLIEASWQAGERELYGRMDMSWSGQGEPKLLEYNADTPTALLEASVVQWEWLECVQPQADQFNSLHECLITRWRELAPYLPQPLYFSCVAEHSEDYGNCQYLLDTALQAGIRSEFIYIEDIGWNPQRGLVDLQDRALTSVFKLYPWEWLLSDAFAQHLRPRTVHWVEPAWKLLASNKALLAALWQQFPGHPNLLPAALQPRELNGPMVRKPLFSREGANVSLPELHSDGPYGAEGYVYQAYAPLPNFSGHYPVLGLWVVGQQAAGLGIREDSSLITRDSSRFIPHYFLD